MSNAKGFDSPTHAAAEDHLRRQPFAREIAGIATTAPYEWSVRIGVYGRWGSGKTSVLNIVQEIAEAQGHLVTRFNPWGCTTEEQLWEEFTKAIVDQAQHTGAHAATELAQKSLTRRKLAKITESLFAMRNESKALFQAISPALKSALSLRGGMLQEIPRALGNKRILVLIDDLDRTDPALLPRLLFGLREVLDTPGYSYILALDPEVVGSALRSHHSGFADGVGFLEKIIEFPRWLPEPTTTDLWNLTFAEVSKHLPFVDLKSLEREKELLPKSPRTLKAFVRSFWALQAALSRHDLDEIRWPLLIRTQLLRNEAPHLIDALASEPMLLDRIIARRFLKEIDPEDKVGVQLKELVNSHVAAPMRERALQLAQRLSEAAEWTSELVIHHAFLGDKPEAITWKEFRTLFRSLPIDDQARHLLDWVRDHSRTERIDDKTIARELLVTCMQYHHKCMNSAIYSFAAAELAEETSRATRVVSMAESIACHVLPSLGTKLTIDDFNRITKAFEEWAHFVNDPSYMELRAVERALLERLVREEWINPVDAISSLKPWTDERHGVGPSESHKLKVQLSEIACQRVATDILSLFEVDSEIAEVSRRQDRAAHRYLIFRSSSPVWSEENVNLLQTFAGASATTIVAENCREFLYVVAKPYDHASDLDDQELHQLAKRKDIIVPLWNAATLRPINIRMLSRLKERRALLEEKHGERLPEPHWWAALNAKAQ